MITPPPVLPPTGDHAIPLLSGAEFKADPYPAYAWLRENAPAFCRTSADGQARLWFLTRFDDVAEALRDHRRFVKDVYNTFAPGDLARHAPEPALYRLLTHHMLNADGATHARLRGLVNQAFSARMIEQLAPRIQASASHWIDRVQERGRMDLIEEYALPFAIDAIAEMLGIDARDHHRLRAWSRVLVAPSASSARNERKTVKLQRVMQDFVAHLERVCAARRLAPRNDLISALLRAEAAGDQLSQDELFSMVLLIVVVGHETSVHLIGNAVLTLLPQAELWALLRDQPDQIPLAVEELIRCAGPVERATLRFAAEDITLHGQTIRRGDAVSLVLASAHHDPSAYAEPDAVDFARADNRHLGFGLGVHYCLGAPLARMEARIALNTLIQRLPDLRLTLPVADLRWHKNPILHGVRRLPVAWGAEKRE